MKLHDHAEEGPPCRHMEGLLNATADGSARGLGRLYALAHAARCGRCNAYLHRLEELIGKLKGEKAGAPEPDVLDRLRAGAWRERLETAPSTSSDDASSSS